MKTDLDLDDLERKARPIADWDEERDAPNQECVACKDGMHTPSELEPTALCNGCAQAYAAATAPVVLALIARIRGLHAFIEAVPDEFLQSGKLGREEAPELFTDEDGNALYMDEAKRRILERGAVLP